MVRKIIPLIFYFILILFFLKKTKSVYLQEDQITLGMLVQQLMSTHFHTIHQLILFLVLFIKEISMSVFLQELNLTIRKLEARTTGRTALITENKEENFFKTI